MRRMSEEVSGVVRMTVSMVGHNYQLDYISSDQVRNLGSATSPILEIYFA